MMQSPLASFQMFHIQLSIRWPIPTTTKDLELQEAPASHLEEHDDVHTQG